MMDVQKPELPRPLPASPDPPLSPKRGKLTTFFGMAPGVNGSLWRQYTVAIAVVAAITLVTFFFGSHLGGPYAAALIYLLGVVVVGTFVTRGPTFAAATLSAMLWNYLILPPIFSFRVAHAQDVLLLGTYFIVALTLGQLTTRIRAQQHAGRMREERARLIAESERLSKTLLNSMSHEMRTPIAVIQSAVNNLANIHETDDPQIRSDIMTAIQNATERLNRLVGNLLDTTRLESGHVKPKITECDVGDLIRLAMANAESELAGHAVAVEIAPDLPFARMDFHLMEQALTNLLSNAVVHTPPGTPVEVRARAERRSLVIEVADRGPGLPAESIERLFDKFYRGPCAPTGGTGLGLSVVKGFVEAQGGSVHARNRAGGGAVFTVQLPLGQVQTVPLEKII